MNMCPSNKRKTAPKLCLKGQVFFIWSNYQSLEVVKDRISLLGGKVDPFLSRDVTTVLVEDNHLVGSQLTSTNLQVKPAYATNSSVVTSFPYQSSLCNVPSTSRGFNLLAASSSNSPYRVICYALQWGIQVLGIGQFLTWIEPQVKTAITLKKKTPDNVTKLSGCFIKFESFYQNYRPCYKMFNNDPDRLLPLKNANVLVKPDNCNIILDKPIVARQVNYKHINIAPRVVHPAKNVNLPVKANVKKVQNVKIKPKEENNYCECCRTHFADLKKHIKSVKHQNFVANEKNYESVNNIIKMLPTAQEFIDKLQNPSPDPGLMLSNADIPNCLPVAITNTGCPLSVNLQIQKDNVSEMPMPIDLHVERDRTMPVIVNHSKSNEDNPLPLDLVKRVNDIKTETIEIKENSLLSNLELTNSCPKNDLDIGLSREEIKSNVKVDEAADDMHCDVVNGDPLFDRSTTAALAQLCLKNFDSYWFDSLPCEMDDMVFDDIFNIDDGKTKTDNDCPEPVCENYVTSEVAQTPGLDSGISTPSFKTPTNTTVSTCVNSSVGGKDIKSESINLVESFPNSNKLDKGMKDLLSSQNTISLNEPPAENKNKFFSIASYCSNKIDVTPSCSSKMEAAVPSCSNAVSNTNTELLFSSDNSDSENENVLISNALHLINHNCDSDMKIEKESGEDNAVGRQSPVEQKVSCTNKETDSATDNLPGLSIPDRPNSKMDVTENLVLTDNSRAEIMNQPKISVPLNRVSPVDVKIDHNTSDKIAALRRNSAEMSKNCWPADDESVPAKKLCSGEIGVDNLCTINFAAVELASNRCKIKAQPLNESLQKSTVPNEIKIPNYDHKVHPLSVKPLSFAEMKMKISPKEIAPNSTWPESKLYENTKFIPSEQNHKQVSISSRNSSSSLISSRGVLSDKVLNNNNNSITQNNIKPSQEVFRYNIDQQQNVQMHVETFAVRQNDNRNVCPKEIKPKHDFSIAHLTSNAGPAKYCINQNDSEIKPFIVKSYHEQKSIPQISDFAQNSWQLETGVSKDCKNTCIPAKDRLLEIKAYDACNVTGNNSGNKTMAYKEEKAIPVLPKKAYGRKYKLYEEDLKHLSTDVNPSTELKICEKSSEKCMIIDHKSSQEIKIGGETNLGLMGTKGSTLCGENKTCFVSCPNQCEIKCNIDTNNVTIDTKAPHISEIPYPKRSFKKQLKDRDIHLAEKKAASVSVKMHGRGEAVTKEHKVASMVGSTNLCQYSREKATENSSSHPQGLPAESSASNPDKKLLQKKSSSKLQQLPPLWSVSILPGSGVKLKFSCVQPQKLGNKQCAERH